MYDVVCMSIHTTWRLHERVGKDDHNLNAGMHARTANVGGASGPSRWPGNMVYVCTSLHGLRYTRLRELFSVRAIYASSVFRP